MDISKIASLAKLFFPNLAANIEKAQLAAANFSPTEQGVRDLMQQFGKSKSDIQNALAMLNNPFVSGAIDRLMPNMSTTLKTAGNAFLQSNSQPSSSSIHSDSFSSLRDKLAKL